MPHSNEQQPISGPPFISQQQGKLVPYIDNLRAVVIMTTTDRLPALIRSRTYYRVRITLLTKQMDDYEESNPQEESDLRHYEKRLNDVWAKFDTT
jgi:hypothetical protein